MNSNASSSDQLKETVHKLLAKQNIALDQSTTKRKRFSQKVSQRDLELAVTVLLVDLASVDQDFDQQEYQVIVHGLIRMFGTSKPEISALINQAQTVLRNLRGVSSFGKLLRENLDLNERKVVMEIIEDVIQADGVEDDYEIYLRYKLSGLLGLESDKNS